MRSSNSPSRGGQDELSPSLKGSDSRFPSSGRTVPVVSPLPPWKSRQPEVVMGRTALLSGVSRKPPLRTGGSTRIKAVAVSVSF